MRKKFPIYRQLDQMDCGPTCLRMIARYYGKHYSVEYLREKCYITREGVSIAGITDAAELIGLKTLMVAVDYEKLAKQVPLPCIVHWRQRHFVIVHAIKGDTIYVADPAFGALQYKKDQFLDGWLYNKKKEDEGIVLLLEPTPSFYEKKELKGSNTSPKGLRFLLQYLRPHKRYLLQLVLGIVTFSAIETAFPFLTQALVDYGINNQNLQFIYLILVGQLMLFFSQTAIGVLRSWIILHMGARVNIAIISDFLIKVMRLPISFFDSKMTADLLQRIEDHRRIENFLSTTTLNMLFSLFSFVIFGCILAFYHFPIFLLFFGFTTVYFLWIMVFSKKRAVLDHKRYDEAAENRSSMIQLFHGMQEIKLNNSEKRRRWEWEGIQLRIFRISTKGLALTQYQSIGGTFLNELKNILITFYSAKSVIDGHISLGMMLSIQYIIGRLNVPISNFITFVQSTQDARLSIDRLNEIHARDNEVSHEEEHIDFIPDGPIRIKDLSFRYGGPSSRPVLQQINLEIPRGKVTAIVGASGSGKTTLLKLLLKFYKPTEGSIYVGNTKLDQVNSALWRHACGVVMQDGFIFADTIARNISESEREGSISKRKLENAVRIANIEQVIENLPLGYNTNLSWGGISLSGGEQQRILIARAIYKNPEFLLFDEATSALDANNEKIIMENLREFFQGRTAVVIAHRLSTVKNADRIYVLDKGSVVEAGTHDELTSMRGKYFTLVKNQLELGQ